MDPPISVVVERESLAESRHAVHAAAVRDGDLTSSRGDPDRVTYMRSAAKPFQALPLAKAAPDLPAAELAIASASHEARPEQLALVESLLARAGACEDDLECGAGEAVRLRHNCSGKHAAMLLLCRLRGWPTEGYRLPEHPLQRELLELVAAASGLRPSEVATATDGCGVVAYALPLQAMARAFSWLAAGTVPGAARILAAMREHPELVGGPDAADTRLMRAAEGAVAKRGAEGVLCGALADGTGFALKAEDGAGRATAPAAGAFLHIPKLLETPLFNSRNERIGTIRAGF